MSINKKAYIFDLDGTLVRTQKEFHAPAEAKVLASHGIVVRPGEISERFSGVHTLEVFRQLAPGYDAHTLLDEKWAVMRQLARTQPIKQMPCAKAVVQYLYDRNIPLAIASASPLQWIDFCTNAIGVWNYFGEFASVDEVDNGKPAPDVFLLAAERLRCDPAECIAIEDGRAGVLAALAAGMETYWLTEGAEEILGVVKITSLVELL